MRIQFQHSGLDTFLVSDLIADMQRLGMTWIIQGQRNCTLAQHSKPQSLDYWMRSRCGNPNTKQAVNQVFDDLVATQKFIAGQYQCPDTGRQCKGLKLV